MYRNVLQTIEGVGVYPLISMFIFLSVFMAAVIWFFRADKERLQHMAQLPLESNFPTQDRKEV